jgi:hypothetical protein
VNSSSYQSHDIHSAVKLLNNRCLNIQITKKYKYLGWRHELTNVGIARHFSLLCLFMYVYYIDQMSQSKVHAKSVDAIIANVSSRFPRDVFQWVGKLMFDYVGKLVFVGSCAEWPNESQRVQRRLVTC